MGCVTSALCLPCQYYHFEDSDMYKNPNYDIGPPSPTSTSENSIDSPCSPSSSRASKAGVRGKRGYVSEEILSTERNFVRHFSVMESVFYDPLQRADIIEATELRDQFSDYFVIKGIHTSLLHDLEKGDCSIAAVFGEYLPSLKLYKEYLQNYERRLKQRAALIVSNSAFKRFLSSTKDNPLGRGQTLESLFVEPVQRLPRYKLLLHEVFIPCLNYHHST
jgi:hypothetical protein